MSLYVYDDTEEFLRADHWREAVTKQGLAKFSRLSIHASNAASGVTIAVDFARKKQNATDVRPPARVRREADVAVEWLGKGVLVRVTCRDRQRAENCLNALVPSVSRGTLGKRNAAATGKSWDELREACEDEATKDRAARLRDRALLVVVGAAGAAITNDSDNPVLGSALIGAMAAPFIAWSFLPPITVSESARLSVVGGALRALPIGAVVGPVVAYLLPG
jgi:hypothetical protein